jgi:hypothetical protein
MTAVHPTAFKQQVAKMKTKKERKEEKFAKQKSTRLRYASGRTKNIKCKKRYRFKKATLYEREVIKSKNFLFAGRSFHTHTTGG